MACFLKRIPYCGISCGDQRSARLVAHLEKTSLRNMTMMGDSLNYARFASVAAGNVPAISSRAAAAAKPKSQAWGRPLSNLSRAQTLLHADPVFDEEPPIGEAALSGGE